MINLPDLKTARVDGKKVFLRTDLNVPLKDGEISDDTRLLEGLETLKYLLSKGAHVILAGHLGRPVGRDLKLSVKPLARWYANKFNSTVKEGKLGEFDGWQIMPNFYLLENLRFHPEEEANDPIFSQKLANLAEIYVDDSFDNAHRPHASMIGVSKLLPHFAGFLLTREVNILETLMENPARPLTVIIGGAKMETKLPVVEKMHQVADYILVGGKIAQEKETLMKVSSEKSYARNPMLIVANLNFEMTDITLESLENFLHVIKLSKTIVWNGPIGITEGKENDLTIPSARLAEAIAESGAYSVIGGGDTIGFVKKIKLIKEFSFVSTGGGAMLDFLSGDPLPGVQALI